MSPSATFNMDSVIAAAGGRGVNAATVMRQLGVTREAAEEAMQAFFEANSERFQLHLTVSGTMPDTNEKVFRRATSKRALEAAVAGIDNPVVSVYALVPIELADKACALARGTEPAIRMAHGAPQLREYPTLTREETVQAASAAPTRSLSDLIRESSGSSLSLPPPIIANAPAKTPLLKTPLGASPAAASKSAFDVPSPAPVPVTAPAVKAAVAPAAVAAQSTAPVAPITVFDVDDDHSAAKAPSAPPPTPVAHQVATTVAPAAVAVALVPTTEPNTPKDAPPRKVAKTPAADPRQRTLTEMFNMAPKRKRDDAAGIEPAGPAVTLEKASVTDSAAEKEAALSAAAAPVQVAPSAPAPAVVAVPAAAKPVPKKQTRAKKEKEAKAPAAKGSLKALAKKGEKVASNTTIIDDEDSNSDADSESHVERVERQRYDEQFESGELQLAVNDDIVLGDGNIWVADSAAAGGKSATAATASGKAEQDPSPAAKRPRDVPLPPSQPRITQFFNAELIAFQRNWERVVITETAKVDGEYVCRDVDVYRHKSSGDQITEDEYRLRCQRVKAASEAASSASRSSEGAAAAAEAGAAAAAGAQDELPQKKKATEAAPARPVMNQTRITDFFKKK